MFTTPTVTGSPEDILQSDSSLEIKPLQGALRINKKTVCGQDSTHMWGDLSGPVFFSLIDDACRWVLVFLTWHEASEATVLARS